MDDQGARIRVLCLHGKGTNSNVMTTTMRPLTRNLGSSIECHYLDGPVPCAPYHGIQQFFGDQPYFAWYDAPTRENLEEAYAYVLTYILSKGPGFFDGIMGFSQGAALAATLAIRHQDKLFRFAAFLCGGRPFDPATGQRYEHVPGERSGLAASPFELELEKDRGSRSVSIRRTSSIDRRNREIAPASASKALSASLYAIRIPTVHLIGLHDSAKAEGVKLMELCDPKLREAFEYDGGHCLPRRSTDVVELASLLRKASGLVVVA
ncbi:uncharacterized protein PFL1_03749 [Pseudozyma flocculosa PF-1]|uniref:Serine hydrolase domain-containing protein n=2 Tax=Pseudozyma flocculosa TaxID=84751 RepID=A0A5C3F2M3_9BASI|nr:uncharacterized protein PFL1_03749 [Pseudozyma flocculosa PF-1]EPQ28949.1 hypothetical protein PFL1_03749 [Pseudozyma flocculosa PF-1]SPO38562.1 uncharacterized protein PSFLO_04040 [Pseudozyma flocculosa]